MKRSLLLWMLVGSLGFVSAACDLTSDDEADTGGLVTLSGQVLDNATNNPIPDAIIQVMPMGVQVNVDSVGRYRFDVKIDSTMDLTVSAISNGFSTTSHTVTAIAGRPVNVPPLRMTRIAAEEAESGYASNILLLEQSAQSIGVRESGSREVAQITFQVADSLGRPIVLDKAVDVRFRLGAHPGGGEFIYPTTARTDNNGKVTVNVSSGTRAGVVQLVAEADVVSGGAARTIRSKPVSLAIHGGLPDQRHFSLGPAKFNFPGLNTFGLRNAISVIVGDKYGNPVKPGTAVYFTTTHGVIGGSTLTDADGQGGVDLLSANPLPHATRGIAVVTARTAGEQGVPTDTVTSQTPVVFSGLPIVSVSPLAARLNQSYNVTVQDQYGNPLAEGTSIAVQVEGTKVKAVGHTSVRLPDTAFRAYDPAAGETTWGWEHVVRGHGITEFNFRAVEDLTIDEDGVPTVEAIKITVSGPNGGIEIVLGPDGSAPKVRTSEHGFHARSEVVNGKLEARLVE